MNEFDVEAIYRQIGKVFREKGADRVILIRSRKYSDKSGMELELAVDGYIDKEELQSESGRLWPEINITIFDMNEEEYADMFTEAIEDGILL